MINIAAMSGAVPTAGIFSSHDFNRHQPCMGGLKDCS
jgi:hypothetical protein